MHRAARNSITDFNENRLESNAMIGAPITTPKAYQAIILPAAGMEIPTSRAMSGSTPIMPNSAMPSPKVPSASEKIVFFIHLIGVLRDGRHY